MNEQLSNPSRQGLFGTATKDLVTAYTEAGISSSAITLEARLIHGDPGQKLQWDLQLESLTSFCLVLKAKYFHMGFILV